MIDIPLAHVILRPYTQDNPSTWYRVVPETTWTRYLAHGTRSYVYTEHGTYSEARQERDLLTNRPRATTRPDGSAILFRRYERPSV